MSDPDDTTTKDPLARWIAISLALIALLGAGLAILQTNASNDESSTARETTRTAVAALRAGVVEKAARQLERDIGAEQQALARREALLADLVDGGEAAAPGQLLRAAGEAGVAVPGQRTEEELRRLEFEAERLRLTQEGLAETRVTWNNRSTEYTTAIALLAVALFLVGFSLVLSGMRRRVFYGLGIAMALGTLAWAAYLYTLPIPETADTAIAAAARGSVEASAGRQRRAIAEFSDAIEIDGDFAAPYAERAGARLLEANPDFPATGAVTGSGAAVDAAVADVRRALELGGNRDFLALSLLALLRFHSGEYDAAAAAADRAIAVNDQVPDIRLLRSAAEAGRGDAAAASESLDGALALLAESDPSERTRRLSARYISYLESVIARAPARAGLARELEARVIRIETRFALGREVPGAKPPRGSVSIEGLSYAGGELRARLRWEDLPPGTALTAIGFERPAPGAAWVQPPGLALFRSVGGSGGQAVAVEGERACTPTEVRVDVYLDGAPTTSETAPGGSPTC